MEVLIVAVTAPRERLRLVKYEDARFAVHVMVTDNGMISDESFFTNVRAAYQEFTKRTDQWTSSMDASYRKITEGFSLVVGVEADEASAEGWLAYFSGVYPDLASNIRAVELMAAEDGFDMGPLVSTVEYRSAVRSVLHGFFASSDTASSVTLLLK